MKRYLIVCVGLAIAALALTAFVMSGQAAPAATATEVGSAVGGVNAVEFVGRVDQDGSNFVSYGYLTHLSGLTDTLLFSGTIPFVNESNAHLTFYTTATLTARNVITGAFNSITSSVFMIDAAGTTVYYYNATPGAAFANPDSFKSGVPVLTATVRSQNILNVQAPARGVGTNFTEFTQTGVSPFTLNGQPYQIGRVGILERLFSTGEGTNTDPITPKSITLVAGNAIVTGLPGQPNFMPIIVRNAP
jgi:hypothetical protein